MTASRFTRLAAGALLLCAFVVVAWLVYAPALDGPFLSDDVPMIVHNPWLHPLGWPSFREVLDPFGGVTRATGNWAPVHMLGHALEIQAFGSQVRGYHWVNLLLHALDAVLLLALLRDHGVAPVAALLGATFFLVHPANVEAVAWITQLKSVLAVAFGLSALLVSPRRPLGGLLLFTLATLTKPLAIGFLAFELVRALMRARRGERGGLGWPLAWTAVAVVTAIPALSVFAQVGAFSAGEPLAGFEKARWLSAILGRYVALASVSWGSSVSAQPAAPRGWLDPWVLLGLVALAACGARALVVFSRGRIEAAFWALAAAGYVPISQLFAFRFPIADRYLYFVLPGLIGAGLLLLQDATDAPRTRGRRKLGIAAAVVAALSIAGLAIRARERTYPWTSGEALLADAAASYPDGTQANLLRATRTAKEGDRKAAVDALARARATGFDDVLGLMQDPTFLPLRRDPRFKALVRDMAAEQIRRVQGLSDPSRLELHQLGVLHILREEWAPAAAALGRALEKEGPGDTETIRRQLELARTELGRSSPAQTPSGTLERAEPPAAGGTE